MPLWLREPGVCLGGLPAPHAGQVQTAGAQSCGSEQPPVPEGGRAAASECGAGVCICGLQHQLSPPGQDTDLRLGMASALARVGPRGFSDRKGCYESRAHPSALSLGSQAFGTSWSPAWH